MMSFDSTMDCKYNCRRRVGGFFSSLSNLKSSADAVGSLQLIRHQTTSSYTFCETRVRFSRDARSLAFVLQHQFTTRLATGSNKAAVRKSDKVVPTFFNFRLHSVYITARASSKVSSFMGTSLLLLLLWAVLGDNDRVITFIRFQR
jgi:hypothetical protein